MPQKLIEFHPEHLHALLEMAEAKSSTVQQFIDEALRDLFEKDGRLSTVKDAFRKSALQSSVQKKPERE